MARPPKQKPGRSKQDYQTPPELLQAVKNRLHINEFVYDLTADSKNTVAPLWYDIEANSLVQNWVWDGWCWCNPPFAKIEPWVEKAAVSADNGATVVMLVPASVGSNWWWRWVETYAHVAFLNPRLTFVGETTPYPKDCAILIYHPWKFTGSETWLWKNSLNV